MNYGFVYGVNSGLREEGFQRLLTALGCRSHR